MTWSRRFDNTCPPLFYIDRFFILIPLSVFRASAERYPCKNLKRTRRVLRGGHFCAKIKRKAEPGERGILISFHRPVKRRMGKKSPTARCPVFRASPRCFRFLPCICRPRASVSPAHFVYLSPSPCPVQSHRYERILYAAVLHTPRRTDL